jgi:hypothetical protein
MTNYVSLLYSMKRILSKYSISGKLRKDAIKWPIDLSPKHEGDWDGKVSYILRLIKKLE